MKLATMLFAATIALGTTHVSAEPVPAGAWLQTSSTAGDCATCELTVRQVTPHIVQITSNNDWTGFAYYVKATDKYSGVFEWNAGEGGDLANTVIGFELTYQGQTLTMDAASEALSFKATYRRK